MTLRDAILNIVPTDSWRTFMQIESAARKMTHYPDADEFAEMLSDEIAAMVEDRTLVEDRGQHHRAYYRQRTVREIGELRAEASGMQGRLL